MAGNPNWKKGISGNPSGRPAHKRNELIEKLYATGLVDGAVKAIKEAMNDPKTKLECAKYVLDQVYGKPVQALEHSGEDGGLLTVQIIAPQTGILNGTQPS